MNETKATRYQRLRRRTQVIGLAISVAVLLVTLFSRADGWLAELSRGFAERAPSALRPAVSLIWFVAALVFAAELVALPLSLSTAARDARAVIGTQSRDALLGAVMACGIAAVLHVSIWVAGPWWWVLASLSLASATMATTSLLALGLSWSGETRSLTRAALTAPLVALATRACGRPIPVHEWATASASGATAMVTGVGRAGAVLLSREMVRDWADDEIAVVVAHELSHHAHHDLVRKAALDAVLWAVTLWLADRAVWWWGSALGVSSVSDLEALPLIALTAGATWCLIRPLRLAQSRAHERRADRFALELTGNTEAFARALRRLGEAHRSEERPSRLTRWFFHRHPTVDERLRASRLRQP